MSEDKININYRAEDIEQYFLGGLSAAQMHAMEKAALDDPFLAEAMEGYEAMKGKEWNTQLVALRKGFSAERPVAKIVPLSRSTDRWWKAAAAILVIASGTVLTYVYTNSKEKQGEQTTTQQIAQNVPVVKNDETIKLSPAKPAVTDISTEKVITKPATGKTEKVKAADRQFTVQENILTKRDSAFIYKPAKNAQSDLAKNQGIISNTDEDKKGINGLVYKPATATNNTNVTIPVEASNSRATEYNYKYPVTADAEKRKANQNVVTFKSPPLNRSFNAQVVGPDNTPLPYSNIAIKSENFGTYADVKGNFRLVSADSVLTVEIRSIGYLPRVYTLRSNQSQNKIVLAEDEIAQRDRTVIKSNDIVANGSTRRPRLVKDSVVNVEPADGWENYNTYIANNIELPDEILKNDRHGEIGITFDVKSNGTISNIKVDLSECNDCEELAKRLIEQGPQWKLKKGKKASAKVKVQF